MVLGKTVTTEFASTEPRGTRNPWDLERTPGGSSSGSAAAVAVGMLPAALGTQVIGSIVRPASFCGVYGFKPSVGAINRGGSCDGLSQSCHGALAATLADAWVDAARDLRPRRRRSRLSRPCAARRACPRRRSRAGWRCWKARAGRRLRRRRAPRSPPRSRRLKAAGVEILDARTTNAGARRSRDRARRCQPVSRTINAWEFRWPLNVYRDQPGLSRAMRERLAQAEAMSREEYQALLAERAPHPRRLCAASAELCDGCVTLPATGAAPLGLGSTGNPICAVAGSLLGVPALSLPLLAAEDLPLGLQIMGFEQQDAAAIGIATWVDGCSQRRDLGRHGPHAARSSVVALAPSGRHPGGPNT